MWPNINLDTYSDMNEDIFSVSDFSESAFDMSFVPGEQAGSSRPQNNSGKFLK